MSEYPDKKRKSSEKHGENKTLFERIARFFENERTRVRFPLKIPANHLCHSF